MPPYNDYKGTRMFSDLKAALGFLFGQDYDDNKTEERKAQIKENIFEVFVPFMQTKGYTVMNRHCAYNSDDYHLNHALVKDGVVYDFEDAIALEAKDLMDREIANHHRSRRR